MNLTPREREVLAALADGLTSKQIGRRVGMAEATANGHVEQIRLKFGMPNRLALVAHYWK